MIDGSQFGRHRHLTRRHRRRAGAAESLRGVLCFCNSPLMNQVEADIQFKPGLISADGAGYPFRRGGGDACAQGAPRVLPASQADQEGRGERRAGRLAGAAQPLVQGARLARGLDQGRQRVSERLGGMARAASRRHHPWRGLACGRPAARKPCMHHRVASPADPFRSHLQRSRPRCRAVNANRARARGLTGLVDTAGSPGWWARSAEMLPL